jgi:NADH-quinone oxidoreductase subunit K
VAFWVSLTHYANCLNVGNSSLEEGALLKVKSISIVIHFLGVSINLFLLGILGIFFNRRSIILILLSIELILLAVNFNFLVFASFLDDLLGQLFALFVLTVAAAESSIGLAILVADYRISGTVSVEYLNLIKG